MKKELQTLVVVALVFSIGLFSTGCKKDDGGTGPPPGGDTQFITIQTPFGPITIPTLGVTNLKGLLVTAFEDTSASALALFLGTNNQLLYAGAVSVNSNDVDTLSLGGQTLYIRPNPLNPRSLTGVNFNGSAHNWTVAGGSGIPAFNGSVTSPNGVPTITSPANNATISRSQALTVTWSGAGSDSVFITVSDSLNNELNAITGGNSYTFSASQMGTLAAGAADIDVSRFKISFVTAGGGTYFIISSTGAEVAVRFN